MGDEVELQVLVENVGDVRSGILDLSVDLPGLVLLGQSGWPSLGAGQSQLLRVRFRVTSLALGGQTTAVVAGPATVRSRLVYVDDNWLSETNLANNSAPLTLTVLRALNLFP